MLTRLASVLLEPWARALPQHPVRRHNRGSHGLSGSDAVPGAMGTACQAACLFRSSPEA